MITIVKEIPDCLEITFENKTKKAEHCCSAFSRGGRIRTCGLPDFQSGRDNQYLSCN